MYCFWTVVNKPTTTMNYNVLNIAEVMIAWFITYEKVHFIWLILLPEYQKCHLSFNAVLPKYHHPHPKTYRTNASSIASKASKSCSMVFT